MAKNLLRTLLKAERRTPGRLNAADLVQKIQSGYTAENNNGFKTKKTFSPSTLVYGHGACPRYWYLAFHGADFQDDMTPYQVANMSNGSMAHERIQKAIENSGILVSKEKKIILNDPPIFGYMDAEISWDDGVLPAEIKTTNDVSFERRKESGSALSYHIAQLLIYMRIEKYNMGVIIYENKNNHELYAVPVEVDDERSKWVDDLFEWCSKVKSASDADLLPKKNYRSNSKVCKSCPLAATCATLRLEGDIVIPNMEPLA